MSAAQCDEEALMHLSRLSTFVIDCKVDDLEPAAEFWSRALNRALAPAKPGAPDYRHLGAVAGAPTLVLQRVEHESRIHLDIECDDLDAEVARLEQLGAVRLRFVKRWWLMQAPTGHVFCVTNRQRPLAGKPDTNQWP
jgi:Glyoxalase-like domain